MPTHTKKPASKNADTPANLNATAYRIFKVLQWLMQEPLGVEGLNARMIADPSIGKALSADSLWLYINTLRALGCNIERPSKKNHFCYTLTGHAFGLGASTEDVTMLADVRQMLAGTENTMAWEDLLALDALVKHLLSDTQGLYEQYLAQSRVIDYSTLGDVIATAQQAVTNKTLMSVTYKSPKHGRENFLLLPDALVYRNGCLYLCGERYPVRNDITLLRIDRINAITEAAQKPDVINAIKTHRNTMANIALVMHLPAPDALQNLSQPFGLGETTRYMTDGLHIALQTRDWFTLKQKILELGFPVFVEKPAALMNELHRTFSFIQQLYDDESMAENDVQSGELAV